MNHLCYCFPADHVLCYTIPEFVLMLIISLVIGFVLGYTVKWMKEQKAKKGEKMSWKMCRKDFLDLLDCVGIKTRMNKKLVLSVLIKFFQAVIIAVMGCTSLLVMSIFSVSLFPRLVLAGIILVYIALVGIEIGNELVEE